MGFWDSASVSVDNLARLGPFVSGTVGTEGKYSTLNSAIAAGWTRILLAPGASLNANLTLSATVSIINPGPVLTIAGNYQLNIVATDCYFEGFRISNNAGVGFYVTGARTRFFRCTAQSCLSHGFHFNAGGGDHEMLMCLAYANGGDGVRCEVNNSARINLLRSQSNTGWGINDLTDIAQISCSYLIANTAGQHNGATTYTDTSVKIT
jgi:hypothetical protein